MAITQKLIDLETKFKMQAAQYKILHNIAHLKMLFVMFYKMFFLRIQTPAKKRQKICNEMTITKKLMHLKPYYLVQLTHHDVLHKMIPDSTVKFKKTNKFMLEKKYTQNIVIIIYL